MVRRADGCTCKGVHASQSKYGNRRVTVFGITFDSKKEAERYLVLRADEKAGRIKDLRLQVPFELIPAQLYGKWRATTYVADFTYIKDDQLVVEDVKGVRTEVYKIKKKLMLYRHGIIIKEV